MSSDSGLSFRAYSKNKIKQAFKSNITSSIRERVISNETYNKIREKSHNFTDNAKDLINVQNIKNKTKGFLPSAFSSEENSTSAKGFYDSLFSPQTENDVYLKVAIICLWVIAMLCIISTIITMFIPIATNRTKGVRMIFFHIFLCEFCYLIYIFLSMINVALDFQLNSFWCEIAKYGMYATVTVMYFALLILSIERSTKFFNCTASWTKIFTNIFVTQFILVFIWIICVTIISIIIYFKKRVSGKVKGLRDKIIPSQLGLSFGIGSSSRQCSIDGQLLPLFKILFIILFIILIVLIIKSIIISTMYKFIQPACCKNDKKKKKAVDNNMTLIFIIILLLNLILSFPFYFISATGVISQFFGKDKPYPMKLKISFILRISSIILQCLVFYTLDTNSYSLLSKVLDRVTCGKFPGSKVKPAAIEKPTSTKQPRRPRKTNDATTSDSDEELSDAGKNNGNIKPADSDTADDDVFISKPKNNSASTKKSKTTQKKVSTDEDDSDEETKIIPKRKLSAKKKDVTTKISPKKDESESEEEEQPIKKTTSKYNNTNGISKQTSNGKPTSQRTSSATTDHKTSKSNGSQKPIKYDPILSDSSVDELSNASVNSDDEIKPTTITKTKIQPAIRSASNEQRHTSTVVSDGHRSHRTHHSHPQRHRTSHSQHSRPIRSASNNHNHIEPTKHRRKSPRNINNYTKKPKQDRLNIILANSDEV